MVWPVRVDPSGRTGPTKSVARRSHWRRTSQGFYVPSTVDPTRPEQRIVEAAVVLPGYGGVTGWAALRWLGGGWFTGLNGAGQPRDVTLATGFSSIVAQPGIAISQERLSPHELDTERGLRLTVPVRAACFEMRRAHDVYGAVVALDMAAYNDLVSIREMSDYVEQHPGWTGIAQCREAITLADENSWSPQESLMRLIWVREAGLPTPVSNVPLFDADGRHLGTPDLLDPHAGVVAEYDGGLHLEGAQRARDIRRDERYRRLGLEVFTMVAGDSHDRTETAHRMRSAYSLARSLPDRRRSWTITPPAWWRPTTTVAERRALGDADRQRFLRLRLRPR
ncbi:hypothetical protein [Nocardioides donggukensis]|uniref:DUF559 domain-containing protein n=1 Tax=Nocardioides donggukensis TaxID=2774019 RepID=A0A927Q0D5_9ACTN|nr:hypothetical protein [Nocardioides donggukensis]MBD8868304.1 hypothetical protein [Nocardioides donggukensis]